MNDTEKARLIREANALLDKIEANIHNIVNTILATPMIVRPEVVPPADPVIVQPSYAPTQ